MLRRSVLQLASRSSAKRVPLLNTTQLPSYLSSRRAFSASQKNVPNKPNSEPQDHVPKVITGGLALGSAVLAAYYFGVLDKYIGKDQKSISEFTNAQIDNKNTQEITEQIAHIQESQLSKPIDENKSEEPDISTSIAGPSEDSIKTEDTSASTQENVNLTKDIELPSVPHSSISSDDATSKPAEESVNLKSPEFKPDEEQYTQAADNNPKEIGIESVPSEKKITTQNVEEVKMARVVLDDENEISGSLLDDYHLQDNIEGLSTSPSKEQREKVSSIEDEYDGYISKDGKLVLDFLEAIHAAEERQAELDARYWAQEKRAMKDKYEKELKDARVRELMYAEREAILDKELNKERIKAAAALKSLQETLEEKLKTELEQKEKEAELKLNKMQDLGKAELAAAIASEKASQIEKMAEANLHINALCMAFYARSEEARQSHSVHKLAMGALALEDALSKGLPIQKEIEFLHTHIDKDSLIDLVISSLPKEVEKNGTDTLPQLNREFDNLKGTLRHFSLIPPNGGGILSHSLAHIASSLKVKEAGQSGDGIESVINRVDILLARGKLCEAVDALENGVKNSQAAEIVDEWVKRARNRAVTEQALAVLQSYASISLT